MQRGRLAARLGRRSAKLRRSGASARGRRSQRSSSSCRRSRSATACRTSQTRRVPRSTRWHSVLVYIVARWGNPTAHFSACATLNDAQTGSTGAGRPCVHVSVGCVRAARTCEGDDACAQGRRPCATRSRLAAVCFCGMLAVCTLVSGGRFVQLLVKIEEEQGKAAHADELRARELAHLRLESEVRASVLGSLPPHVHTRERTAAPNRAPQIARTLARRRSGRQTAAWASRPAGSQPASGRCGQTGGA